MDYFNDSNDFRETFAPYIEKALNEFMTQLDDFSGDEVSCKITPGEFMTLLDKQKVPGLIELIKKQSPSEGDSEHLLQTPEGMILNAMYLAKTTYTEAFSNKEKLDQNGRVSKNHLLQSKLKSHELTFINLIEEHINNQPFFLILSPEQRNTIAESLNKMRTKLSDTKQGKGVN